MEDPARIQTDGAQASVEIGRRLRAMVGRRLRRGWGGGNCEEQKPGHQRRQRQDRVRRSRARAARGGRPQVGLAPTLNQHLGHLQSPPPRLLESARMRVMCPILVLLAALSAPADVIHLKNGRTIWADQVREDKNKDRVEYDVGEDTYAIPKSSVERIDAGGAAPVTAGHGTAAAEMPDFAPATTFSHESDLNEKIVREGKVDAEALAALDRAGNPALTATGYFLAGKYESDHGNFPQAKKYYETALRLQPESPTLLIYYAASLMR